MQKSSNISKINFLKKLNYLIRVKIKTKYFIKNYRKNFKKFFDWFIYKFDLNDKSEK